MAQPAAKRRGLSASLRELRYICLADAAMPLPPWKSRTRGRRGSFPLAGELRREAVPLHRRDPAGDAARPTPPSRLSRTGSSRRSGRAASSASTRTRRARSRPRSPGGTSSSPRRRRAARASASTCPVLQALTEDPDARALYLFPTKALARDQEAGLARADGRRRGSTPAPSSTTATRRATRGAPRASARASSSRTRTCCTRGSSRITRAGRARCRTCATSSSTSSTRTAASSARTWRTCCGASLRVARFHGSNPQILGRHGHHRQPARARRAPLRRRRRARSSSSARAARRAASGASSSSTRRWSTQELGIRASYVKQAVMLASDLVRARVPTIVFGQSRNAVEVMLRYLRDAVATRSRRTDKGSGVDPSRIMAYRGGYLPEQRRDIERRLRDGEILCVVATNALELGIDIGELDAVVCAGYPGSVAATWQRFGRAGRRGAESICVLVASSAPLDQYLAREPAFLLGAPVGGGAHRPGQRRGPRQHLKCAAFELPVQARRGVRLARRRRRPTDALSFLARHRVVHESRGTFHWAADAYPANDVSLRSVGWDNVVIVDVEHDRVDRRARLARRAHDAARAGHLPARRRVLAGRALRLREPQGVRPQASSPTTGPRR